MIFESEEDEESEYFISSKKKWKKKDFKEEIELDILTLIEVAYHKGKEEKNKDIGIHEGIQLPHSLGIQK